MKHSLWLLFHSTRFLNVLPFALGHIDRLGRFGGFANEQLDRVLASAQIARQYGHVLVHAQIEIDDAERSAPVLVLRILPERDRLIAEETPAAIPRAQTVRILFE